MLLALLIFVLVKQVPLWLHSNEQMGAEFSKIKAVDLDGETISLPLEKRKAVYIFWATWCGPCHIQLAQFEKSVSDGSLNQNQIIAVSLDESTEALRAFIKEKAYSFSVVQVATGQSWTDLNVQATPTIIFVNEKGRVHNFFTGLSPLSVFKAKNFLK